MKEPRPPFSSHGETSSCFYVRHMKAAHDWDALSGLPLLIGIDTRRLGLVEFFDVERHELRSISH